jgi:hypothetical protein
MNSKQSGITNSMPSSSKNWHDIPWENDTAYQKLLVSSFHIFQDMHNNILLHNLLRSFPGHESN